MKEKDPKLETQPSGNQPPPRPPKRTAVAANPDDDGDDSRGRKPEKESFRINLPLKSSSAPTIKLPALPPGQSAFESVKLNKRSATPALVPAMSRHPRVVYNLELGMILAAVLSLNGLLYVLCRL